MEWELPEPRGTCLLHPPLSCLTGSEVTSVTRQTSCPGSTFLRGHRYCLVWDWVCTQGPSWCRMEVRMEEKEGHPGQTLLTPPCSMGELLRGGQELSVQTWPSRALWRPTYQGRRMKYILFSSFLAWPTRFKYSYICKWTWLVGILTLGPENLRCGPKWNFLHL